MFPINTKVVEKQGQISQSGRCELTFGLLVIDWNPTDSPSRHANSYLNTFLAFEQGKAVSIFEDSDFTVSHNISHSRSAAGCSMSVDLYAISFSTAENISVCPLLVLQLFWSAQSRP